MSVIVIFGLLWLGMVWYGLVLHGIVCVLSLNTTMQNMELLASKMTE